MIDGEDYELGSEYPARGKRASNYIGWAERDEKEGWIWLSH